jgi:hypothetical protein
MMAKTIDDPVLGHLVWDDGMNWYTGETEVTRGHKADLYLDRDNRAFWSGQTDIPAGPPSEEKLPSFLARAAGTLQRLRRDDVRLRRLAAEALRQRYPDHVKPLSVREAAARLWVMDAYIWHDGSARIDWGATPWILLNWNSSNWISHIGPRGACREIDWEA